ncbi:LysR family transcriptional regulator [Weissella koreensis]|uniref:LysR family transcriptional regulator n=1 Tax=Weissella koreensis TaxID=165096 RepID=A0A7H1MNF4_9LACO|nr:LysR family transcriptional regulator [Weissella koreensis]AVH75788.1 transcriptional regulator [Weissella koreensis]QGN21009.1 LysR family transcriptional regulator [Weissella koreensis]QNT64990.1 LysR family transcriptional regulator [Weissella koreensis]
MKTEDFEYFNELYNKKSFTKVAQIFGVSQPSISTALKRLESNFKSKLVIRGNAQTELHFTAEGEQLYKHTSSIMLELGSAQHELNHLKSHITTIGLPPMLKNAYFAKIVAVSKEFDKYFNIKNMHIYEAGSNVLKKSLLDGEVDIALLGSLNNNVHDELNQEPFVKANFKIFVSKKNPLSKKKSISFADLKKEQFIALDSNFVHNQAMTIFAKDNNIRPNFFMKTSDINFLMNMVAENLGIALLADIVNPNSSNIVVLPLNDENQPTFIGSIAFRRNHILTPEEQMFSTVLSKYSNKKKDIIDQ